MEWWGYLTGGVGAVLGIYGAWRSWRTDRRFKLLEERWVLTRVDQYFTDLTSRLTHTALNVEITGENDVMVKNVQGPLDSVPPGDFRRIIVIVPYGGKGGAVVVTWSRRFPFGRRRRSMRVPMPPQ